MNPQPIKPLRSPPMPLKPPIPPPNLSFFNRSFFNNSFFGRIEPPNPPPNLPKPNPPSPPLKPQIYHSTTTFVCSNDFCYGQWFVRQQHAIFGHELSLHCMPMLVKLILWKHGLKMLQLCWYFSCFSFYCRSVHGKPDVRLYHSSVI